LHHCWLCKLGQVPNAFYVGFMDRSKNGASCRFGINKFGKFGFVMNLIDPFWNTMFEKELPKYKDCLDTIFPHCPFETINVNIASSHVFSHLQNCLINITYVVDPKFLPNLGISNVGNKV